MTMRIYQVRTETSTTGSGHTHDRFNVAAKSFDEAVLKAKKSPNIMDNERIQDITLVAQED